MSKNENMDGAVSESLENAMVTLTSVTNKSYPNWVAFEKDLRLLPDHEQLIALKFHAMVKVLEEQGVSKAVFDKIKHERLNHALFDDVEEFIEQFVK